MKVLYWILGIVLGVPALLFGGMYTASELGGEVVTLERANADGDPSHVRIWIVDQGDVSWIEHGAPDSHWITRLERSPALVLRRDGRTVRYLGTPDPNAHALYHQLRREKYGWADVVVESMTGDGADQPGVPVRLEVAR